MKNLNDNMMRTTQYKSYLNYDDSSCYGIENISIFVHKAKARKRKKYKVYTYRQQASKLTRKHITRCSSLNAINTNKVKLYVAHASHSGILMKKSYHQNDPKYFIDLTQRNPSLDVSNNLVQTTWTVFRCQLNTKEESCCCSCNSDAMFEVMKSLYDCYKKKNCDHCNCILCSHLPRDERELGRIRKSLADIGATMPSDAEKREKTTKALSDMVGKSGPEKEKILRDLAMSNIPLPEAKTPSERNLIKKVRRDLGLPPEPDNLADKAKLRKNEQLGIGVIPLEGKTPQQKEKILRGLADRDIPLPEGRTPSEKALINKIRASRGVPLNKIASEKFRKAKTPEEKENVLKDLANQGLPFPEGKTPSDRKLMDKVRNSLGLPPEPKTPSLREKYNKAANDGLLLPLEGKNPAQKEKILQDLADRGIPLPEGRTQSEKALIAKVKARPPSKKTPSEKIRRAKAAGFITPLQGKTPEQREKILKGLADMGVPFPEGKTPSEKKLIAKVRADLGLPPEPKSPSMRDKYNKAANDGLIIPLQGKTPAEKEKILQDLADRGIPLPEGRTPSEKALVAKVKARPRKARPPSEKLRKAKAAGFLTPLQGKSPEQKEKILKGLANMGLPLPEAQTPSEKKLLDKIRIDLGLPPEPKTPSLREKYINAANEGVLVPLEGKTPAEKEKILQDLANRGIPLPEGRTPSEKALILKIKARPKVTSPSEKMRNAKAAGLITPLQGKTPEEREKILKGLANMGLPLPEGKTPSDRKIIAKVRADLGLPPEPKTPSMRDKHNKAANDGVLFPLEGKTAAEKEKILKDLAARDIPLPEGRTPSEKALIAKIKLGLSKKPLSPSEKMRQAKAAGLLTPLKGKTPEDREKILKGLAMLGLPLPEGKTPSEKDLIIKVRADLGLPPEPTTPSMRDKYNKAAKDGNMIPLEGKTPAEKEKILTDLLDRGIPLPEGRTPSEKSLIARIKLKLKPPSIKGRPSERLRRAKAAGLLTPLKGKTPEQKQNILKGLAMHGLPLPEGQTPSDKKLIDKVRNDLGLPPEPKTSALRDKYKKAADAGLMVPLEGKTPAEKEKILQGLANMGLPLPEGRTPSEKKLIAKVKHQARPPSEGRKSRRRSEGAPALPLQERKKLDAKTAKVMKESKGPSEECICDLLTPASEREKISKGLVPGSVLAEKLREAKAAGLLTPLEGKSPEQKDKILRGLAKRGLPLPESTSPSEKKLIDKIRTDLGLPPEPRTPSTKQKYNRAQAAGLVTPLEGKSPAQKEKILKDLLDMGVPLPEGRTPSEKAMISAVKKGHPVPKSEPTGITTEKIRKAKAAGLLTPLDGKTPEQKEKILKGLAKAGYPLPEGKSPSDKALIRKIKSEFKIADDPAVEKMRKARAAGLVTPLRGKTPAQKEKILRGMAAAGLPLPEGKTPSEKDLIKKVKADTGYKTPTPSERMKKAQAAGLLTPLKGKTPEQKRKALRARLAAGIPLPEGSSPSEKELLRKLAEEKTPSEKIRDARAAGFLTPLQGKTPEQKEKILRGLAKAGLPFPETKTASERSLANKVRDELGLPPEPRSPSLKDKYKKAQAAGIITPLEGKTPAQKENILKKLQDAGLPLPEGRTPSEKSMIKKLKSAKKLTPAQKLKEAKAAGLLTPLEGKTPAQKEKILRGIGKAGLPLPDGKTDSEQALINKVRKDLGLPPEPKSPSMKDKMRKAQEAGILTPLEGKSPAQKEKILKDLADAGIPLPEGRTPSEKALIGKVRGLKRPSKVTSEKLRKAKAAGLMTPLKGKKPAEKEKIVRGLADLGLPLPEGTTPSEKSMINKIRTEKGIPPPAVTPSEKEIVRKAKAEGLLTPITGKTPKEKERILRGLADAGLPLPIGTTPSEKALVKKVRADAGLPLEPTPSEKRGKIKTKAKKVGSKISKAKGGIGEEFEDIVKTTKCDRGCGCDKKKIRFKHSYVKIRVTSPDFSSICACPDECFPRIKGGILTDNEGIKVTVGSAVGVPSYSKEPTHNRSFEIKSKSLSKLFPNTDNSSISTESIQSSKHINESPTSRTENYCSKVDPNRENKEFKYISSIHSNDIFKYNLYNTESDKTFTDSHEDSTPAICEDLTVESEGSDTSLGSSTCSIPISITLVSTDSFSDTYSGIISIRTESSLKLSSSSSLSDVYRSGSTSSNNPSSNSLPFVCCQRSSFFYNTPYQESYTSDSNELINQLTSLRDKSKLFNANKNPNEFLIFRVTQSKFNSNDKTNCLNKRVEPLIIINDLKNKSDIMNMVDGLLAKRELSDTSLFLVVPSSDENSVESSSGLNSTIGIQETDTDSDNYDNSESTISVNKHTLIGTTLNEELKEKVSQSKIIKDDLEVVAVKDDTINKNPSPISNSKIVKSTFDIKDASINNSKTSTIPSVHEKRTNKNYFNKFLRTKHATKNRPEVTSTSASSLDKRPRRYHMKWPRRSASQGRRTYKHCKKETNPTAENDKSLKVHEQLQVQTLFKNDKIKRHKRCQVAVPKVIANKTKDDKEADNNLHTTAVISKVPISNDQCVSARLDPDPDVEYSTNKNETKVFRASTGRNVCPLHGINWSFNQEFDIENSNEYRLYEQPSEENSLCPIHGYKAVRDDLMIRNDINSSTPTSNYYSSDMSVRIVRVNSSKSWKAVALANKLLGDLRSAFNKPASCQCDTELVKGTVLSKLNDRWKKFAKWSNAECQCGTSKLDANTGGAKKTGSGTGDKKIKGKEKKDGAQPRNAEDKRSKDKRNILYGKDARGVLCKCGEYHSPLTSSDSKEKKTKAKLQSCECALSMSGDSANKQNTIWDKLGIDGTRLVTCECGASKSGESKSSKEKTAAKGKLQSCECALSMSGDSANKQNTIWDKLGIDGTRLVTCECGASKSGESKSSKEKFAAKGKLQSCECALSMSGDSANKQNTIWDKLGIDGTRLVTCECGASNSGESKSSKEKTAAKGKLQSCECALSMSGDSTHKQNKVGDKLGKDGARLVSNPGASNSGESKSSRERATAKGNNASCQCGSPRKETGNRKGVSKGRGVICECKAYPHEPAATHDPGEVTRFKEPHTHQQNPQPVIRKQIQPRVRVQEVGEREPHTHQQNPQPVIRKQIQPRVRVQEVGERGEDAQHSTGCIRKWHTHQKNPQPVTRKQIQPRVRVQEVGERGKNVDCQCGPSEAVANTNQYDTGNSSDSKRKEKRKKDEVECQCDELKVLKPVKIKNKETPVRNRAPYKPAEYTSSNELGREDCDLVEPLLESNSNEPPVLLPGEYHDLQIVYLRDIMKMYSECSQTTSGFTMNVLRRPPPEPEPSYEEVWKFYKKHAKRRKLEYPAQQVPSIDCGCPFDATEAEEFKGFKLAVEAKGHSSKGLLCFKIQT